MSKKTMIRIDKYELENMLKQMKEDEKGRCFVGVAEGTQSLVIEYCGSKNITYEVD